MILPSGSRGPSGRSERQHLGTDRGRSGGNGGEDHLASPVQLQSFTGREQGRSGGDDVVDDDDITTPQTGASPKLCALQPIGAPLSRLGCRCASTVEKPLGRHTQLPAYGSCDFFGLIETTLASALRARRRPCDDIHIEMPAGVDQSVHDETAEVAGDLTPVAIFQREHDVARPPGECDRSDHPVILIAWRLPDERETAGGADGMTGRVAAGATGVEEHEAIMNAHCHRVRGSGACQEV